MRPAFIPPTCPEMPNVKTINKTKCIVGAFPWIRGIPLPPRSHYGPPLLLLNTFPSRCSSHVAIMRLPFPKSRVKTIHVTPRRAVDGVFKSWTNLPRLLQRFYSKSAHERRRKAGAGGSHQVQTEPRGHIVCWQRQVRGVSVMESKECTE